MFNRRELAFNPAKPSCLTVAEDHPQSVSAIARSLGITRARFCSLLRQLGKSPAGNYQSLVDEGLMEQTSSYHLGTANGMPKYYLYYYKVFTPEGIRWLNRHLIPATDRMSNDALSNRKAAFKPREV